MQYKYSWGIIAGIIFFFTIGCSNPINTNSTDVNQSPSANITSAPNPVISNKPTTEITPINKVLKSPSPCLTPTPKISESPVYINNHGVLPIVHKFIDGLKISPDNKNLVYYFSGNKIWITEIDTRNTYEVKIKTYISTIKDIWWLDEKKLSILAEKENICNNIESKLLTINIETSNERIYDFKSYRSSVFIKKAGNYFYFTEDDKIKKLNPFNNNIQEIYTIPYDKNDSWGDLKKYYYIDILKNEKKLLLYKFHIPECSNGICIDPSPHSTDCFVIDLDSKAIESNYYGGNFTLSPDEKKLLFIEEGKASNTINVINLADKKTIVKQTFDYYSSYSILKWINNDLFFYYAYSNEKNSSFIFDLKSTQPKLTSSSIYDILAIPEYNYIIYEVFDEEIGLISLNNFSREMLKKFDKISTIWRYKGLNIIQSDDFQKNLIVSRYYNEKNERGFEDITIYSLDITNKTVKELFKL